ncbi:MAG: DNA mismatch repair protein MutS, partial [Candidatus Kapaibacteriota bacterium]
IEVVTPGIALNDRLLSARLNNFVCALYSKTLSKEKNQIIGLAFADVSTGEFFVTELHFDKLRDFFETHEIKEIIIPKSQKTIFESFLQKINFKGIVNKLEPWIFDKVFAKEALLNHFATTSLKGFGIEHLEEGITSAGALLYHIKETQPTFLKQIKRIQFFNTSLFMFLDLSTKRNLEIYSSINNDYEGGLFSVIDKTLTPMGARCLKRWVSLPLNNLERIQQRLEIVDFFFNNDELRSNIRNYLKEISDIERLVSKICSYRATPRDVLSLKKSLDVIPFIKEELISSNVDLVIKLRRELLTFDNIRDLIQKSIREDASNTIGNGEVIKKGFDKEFDNLIDLATHSKQLLKEYQDEERAKTNIPTLKVGFNNVFGYYIEVTKTHTNKIPPYFERKQTLTTAERYTTPKLKNIEEKLLNLEFKIQEI